MILKNVFKYIVPIAACWALTVYLLVFEGPDSWLSISAAGTSIVLPLVMVAMTTRRIRIREADTFRELLVRTGWNVADRIGRPSLPRHLYVRERAVRAAWVIARAWKIVDTDTVTCYFVTIRTHGGKIGKEEILWHPHLFMAARLTGDVGGWAHLAPNDDLMKFFREDIGVESVSLDTAIDLRADPPNLSALVFQPDFLDWYRGLSVLVHIHVEGRSVAVLCASARSIEILEALPRILLQAKRFVERSGALEKRA